MASTSRTAATAPATIHSTQPNTIPIVSPTVAATARRTPAGRTVRALHSAAAAVAVPALRRDSVAHTTARTSRRPPAPVATVRTVVSLAPPVAATVRLIRVSVGLIQPRDGWVAPHPAAPGRP